ncbi:MAG: acyl-CoA desaturase, partial [Actinomycetota bacterium]|nr:acyl-CoA desaturase [Actinomycetota bacterium]
MTATVEGHGSPVDADGPKPMFGAPRATWPQIGTYLFILVPFIALIAAVPLAWGWGLLGWVDIVLAATFYT